MRDHQSSTFLTLTYSDENLPRLPSLSGTTSMDPVGLPTLSPEHLRNWLKRFRKEIEPSRVRYFAVGEYGDETQRPHYHVALFGFPSCSRGRTLHLLTKRDRKCCDSCEMVQHTWGLGAVDLGQLNVHTAQYIAGYVTKKLTQKDDARLLGRHPEFARMSLKPGIGANALPEIASTILEFDLVESQGDVPSTLRVDGRLMPLGRYLRRKLREQVGMEPNAPESTLAAAKERLQEVLDASIYAEALASPKNGSPFRKDMIRNAVIDAGDVKAGQMENRQKIFRQKRSL